MREMKHAVVVCRRISMEEMSPEEILTQIKILLEECSGSAELVEIRLITKEQPVNTDADEDPSSRVVF